MACSRPIISLVSRLAVRVPGYWPVKRWTLYVAVVAILAAAEGPPGRATPPGEAIFPELRSSLEPIVPLEKGWADPPREARTRCWWWWLNGNVTPEAITRDLEEM